MACDHHLDEAGDKTTLAYAPVILLQWAGCHWEAYPAPFASRQDALAWAERSFPALPRTYFRCLTLPRTGPSAK